MNRSAPRPRPDRPTGADRPVQRDNAQRGGAAGGSADSGGGPSGGKPSAQAAPHAARPPARPHLALWLWRGYLSRHRAALALAFALMATEGAMLGLLSYLVEPMFDRIFVAGQRGAVLLIAAGVSGVFIVRALAGFTQRVITSRVGERVTARLQADLVGHLMTLDARYFADNAPGLLIERVRGDTLVVARIWSTVLAAAGRDAVSLLSLLAVAVSIDPLWTLIAVAGAPLLLLPISALQRWVRRTTREARGTAAILSTRLDEIFHGITTIKLNLLEPRERTRFATALDAFVGAQVRSVAGQAGIPALIDVVAAIGFFGVLTYGGYQIIDGEKSVGEFMSFFTAMALIFEPLRRLGNVSGAWQAAAASLERLHAVFEERPTIRPPATARPLPLAGPPEVRFDGVGFAYGAERVLDGASFTAEAGATTALVGPSGAGKSTVFALITRLVDAGDGAVRIGGLDVRDLDLGALRAAVSVVSQDAMLFDDTLRANIVQGARVPPARLDEVLRAAHIDFLDALPDGLDSQAGPRGQNLSGGQRQRVAIARALLRDTPLLLLDEATSALDAAAEAKVQAALAHLARGRTTLVIAHRLSTIRDAQKIVVLSAGRIVAEGTHEALLARGGLYADLHALQSRAAG